MLDEAAKQRLWEHRQSVNSDFNNMSNYFLLAQSFLLIVATSNQIETGYHRLIVGILGFTLSVIWLYVQAKQKFILDGLKRRCAAEFPEYAETRAGRAHTVWRFSNTAIVARLMPTLFGLTWIAIISTTKF
ncbi:RipA family octameric membrane protein [Nocardia gipuzkoensis]